MVTYFWVETANVDVVAYADRAPDYVNVRPNVDGNPTQTVNVEVVAYANRAPDYVNIL